MFKRKGSGGIVRQSPNAESLTVMIIGRRAYGIQVFLKILGQSIEL